MPGLAGVLGVGRPVPGESRASAVLDRMLAVLRHRSWYQVARHEEPGRDLALGHVHLGVLPAGPHPYVDPASGVQVFLHGELYNDEAARDPHGFVARCHARHGRDFAAFLNGSFVVVLHDPARACVLVATDRIASKPLFYWHDGARLYVAPELKALVTVPELPRTLDRSAVASFLSAGHFLNGQTLLESVRALDSGTVLTLTATGVRTHRYWEFTFAAPERDPGAEHYRAVLVDLLRTAVRRRLRNARRYGVLLSGGYDSRGILGACLAERPGAGVVTISWGTTESAPQSDCAVARRVAGQLGTEHHFLPLRPAALGDHLAEFVYLHDGLTDACRNYPEALRLFEMIRAELGVDVVLRGDECFGFSQPVCDERSMLEKYKIVPVERLRPYPTILRPDACARLSTLLVDTTRELSRRCQATDLCARQTFYYLDQRVKHYLNPLNAFKGLAVEVRTPYFDNDVLDFMERLPSARQFGKQLYRETIVSAYPALFREVATVTNLGDWDAELKTPALADFVRDGLVDAEQRLAEFLDPDALGRVVDEYFAGSPRRRSRARAAVARLRPLLVPYPALYRFTQRRYRALSQAHTGMRVPVSKILLRLLVLGLSVAMLVEGRDIRCEPQHA
jgi:asparagine synthetase B (glutamine-hydrolysing)